GVGESEWFSSMFREAAFGVRPSLDRGLGAGDTVCLLKESSELRLAEEGGGGVRIVDAKSVFDSLIKCAEGRKEDRRAVIDLAILRGAMEKDG
ncbi:unnamed protein product, partial [Prorocentrum cordatum]